MARLWNEKRRIEGQRSRGWYREKRKGGCQAVGRGREDDRTVRIGKGIMVGCGKGNGG